MSRKLTMLGLNSFNFCNFFNSNWSFSCSRPLFSSSSSLIFKISSLSLKSSSVFSFSSLNCWSLSCISCNSFSNDDDVCFVACFLEAFLFFGDVLGWERLSWFSFAGSSFDIAGAGDGDGSETFPAKMLASSGDGFFSLRALRLLLGFLGLVSATAAPAMVEERREREAWRLCRCGVWGGLGEWERRGLYTWL